MESAATYLRDEVKLAKAVELYSQKAPGATFSSPDVDAALQLYFDSTADINTLAQLWGMGFVMICDLPDKNKSGNIFIGPYCGCFFSLPGKTPVPFMSVAFKGTNFADIGEGIVDFVYDTFKAPADRLFGANVSTGVYDSLFSQFDINQKIVSPWALIQETLADVAKLMPKGTNPIIHVTVRSPISARKAARTHTAQGHSLGASYSCFCFAQLLTDLKPTRNSGQLGDIYNFGCPRVGYSDWSELFHNAMESHKGTSVRVVNEKDLVPQLVPLIFRDSPPYYNHIDSGWNVFPNAPPQVIETERGTAPPALDWIWDWASDLSDHCMVPETSFEEDLANYVEQILGAITLL